MKSFLEKREAMAVMIIQAIICKRETVRPGPKEAAELAVKHTDCLLKKLDQKSREKVSYLEDWSKKKVLQ